MMFIRFLLVVALLVATFALTSSGLHYRPVVNAQETKTDTTGYPTGAKCPKTGTYRASNGKLEIILVVEAGKLFPTFSDGSKTLWYPVKGS
jgi:hypothetical protein